MNKMMKKIMASALALTIVGGGLPALTGGTDIFKPAIVANAEEEAIIPAVGVTIKFNEIFKCVKNHDTRIPYYFTCDGEKIIDRAYDDDNSMLKLITYWRATNNGWGIAFNPSDGVVMGDYGIQLGDFVDGTIAPPEERHYEQPIGVKIVSGTGTESDPFKLELAYEGDPLPLETDVKVGKKWYIGDTISTDAVFSVTSSYYDFYIGNRQLLPITTKLRGKKLPKCITSTVEGETGADFMDVTIGDIHNKGASSIFFSDYDDSILGIEIVGGSGTEEDPFTLAPILANQPSLVSNTMTLGGSISLNFYYDLSQIPADKKADTYVEFEVNGKKQTANFDANKMNSKKTAYGFTCMLTSVSMADDVKATMHYFDENGNEKTFVTTSNGQAYLQKFDDTDGEKTYNLVKAVNDFGYHLQKYLCTAAATPWTYGVDHVSMAKCFTDTSAYLNNRSTYLSELESYAKQINKNADINKFNYSLSLEADTTLIVRVKPEASYTGSLDITVTDSDNNPVAFTTSKMADGRTQVNIPNISAHKLGDTYTVSVKTTNGTSTFKASALSYVYAGIKDFGSAEELNAMCSIYEYYKKTIAFRTK